MTVGLFATDHPCTVDEDISSTTFWAKPFDERELTFARLRRDAPVSWHVPLEDPRLPPQVHRERGFWAVTRAADIQHVSQHHDVFSSAFGGISFRPANPEILPQSPLFIEMDPPEHTRYRQIMSAAFTPKAVRALSEKIETRAAQIVEAVVGTGDINIVADISAKLPMLTIADMVGVPEDLTATFARAGDDFLAAVGGEQRAPAGVDPLVFIQEQMQTLAAIGIELVQHRRTHPAEDIATALAQARIDGRELGPEQIASMMLLLSTAGNDTTKQTTSWTLLRLSQHPDQWAWLREDFDARIGGAIEEFIRHACPVIQFARTATKDVELGGQQITAGDKVVLFYCSGNRDETVFAEPRRFDLSRPRTAHVGFGGGGVHYCLGNGVAKAQLRALFANILDKLPHLRVTGAPSFMQSELINGITALPARTG